MGCTQGKWPGEIVSDYGCSSATVAIVDAAFVGGIQTWSFLVRFSGASRTGTPLRTYWVSAYGYQAAIRGRPASVVGVEDSGGLDHLLLPHGELV